MKNLKIKYKILIPVAFLVLIVIASNVLQYKNIATMGAQTDLISNDLLPRIELVLNLDIDLSDYRGAQYAYILSTSQSDKKKYAEQMEEAAATFEKHMAEYGSKIRPDQDEQQGFFKTIEQNWNDYKKEAATFIQLANQGQTEVATQRLFDSIKTYDAVGDAVKGIVAVNKRNANNAGLEADESFNQSRITSIALVIILTALGGFLVILLVNGIGKPITAITGYMNYLSGGKLDKDVPYSDQKDEVGEMAHAIQVFKDNMVRAKELEAAEIEERKAKEVRQNKINAATSKFEGAMAEIVKFVASASTELQSAAQSLSATADQTSKQAGVVAASSQEAAANVQTVASASEELTASINEIATQVSRSSEVASKAVKDAREAGAKVAELVEAAQRIGDVTKMIGEIAEQTNLLALNATIESARAGEAGKGFAVVASEVKNLATESTKATEEISAKIAEVQLISQGSAEAINAICNVIEEINEISSTISAAIQEQTAATQEISRNVSEAYVGTSQVTENISTVSDAANDTGSASQQVLSAAQELASQSTALKNEFDEFINGIKAA